MTPLQFVYVCLKTLLIGGNKEHLELSIYIMSSGGINCPNRRGHSPSVINNQSRGWDQLHAHQSRGKTTYMYLFQSENTYIYIVSQVNIQEDPNQIVTECFFAHITSLDLYFKHTKSRTKSENMKFDFFLIILFRQNSVYSHSV